MVREIGIIGYPLGHTLSPRIHESAFDALNLDIKFISAGKLNDNLMGKVKVLKRTKTLVFISSEIIGSNGIVATASGTWKIL